MKCLLTLLLSLLAFSIYADDYVIDAESDKNLIQIESTAKLEFISGESTDIVGFVKFNPNNTKDTTFAIIQVDLRQLNTGIETRDEHMRGNHLHTDDYPFAYFELFSVSGLPDILESGFKYNIVGEGYFYIHGVKRKLYPEIELIWSKSNNQFSVSTNFQIELDKYKIPRPKALFLKLAEVIEVDVKFIGYSGLQIPNITLPEYQELP